MKILHITPHMGGGVGTVIMDWMEKIDRKDVQVCCLDSINDKGYRFANSHLPKFMWGNMNKGISKRSLLEMMEWQDIVLVHYWDHPMLAELFSNQIPDSRMVFWCHKNIEYSGREFVYPDLWVNTSPIQGYQSPIVGPGPYIWSTGNMERFLKLKPIKHEGFNIGTVCSPKIHPKAVTMFRQIRKLIPDSRFTVLGEWTADYTTPAEDLRLNFVGKVDDVAPYLAEMDLFLYPLRQDHYGTCEIALGEAMCAGIPPIVMDNLAEREIVVDSKSGFVEQDTEIPIDDTMYLQENQKRRIQMGRAAKRRGKKLYSIDNMIASWNQVFESMMQNPRTRKEPI